MIWPLIVIGVGVALIVLFIGAPVERRIRDHARDTPAEQDRIDMEQRPLCNDGRMPELTRLLIAR